MSFVRVAADELVHHGSCRVLGGEGRRHLSVHDGLKQQVADFLTQGHGVITVDRFNDFVRLLK